MTWQDCFEKYKYSSLIYFSTEKNARIADIESFEIDGKIPQELREIYLSLRGDELFLVLQPPKSEGLEEFCSYWDSAILTWVQIGKLPGNNREGIRKLQYNITMILLYRNKYNKKASTIPFMDEPSSFELEKSTSVSRKVFLPCGDDDTVEEEDLLQIPFWYDKFETAFHDSLNDERLKNLLPKKEQEKFLLKKREKINRRGKRGMQDQMYFTDEEFQVVKGWLKNV